MMLKLRSVEFADYITIASIHSQSWKKTYRNILTDKFLDEKVDDNRLQFWYKRLSSPMPNQKVTLAINNGDSVGFSCLYLDYDPYYGSLLDNLHVLHRFQKSGAGKLLIQHCAKTILENSTNLKMYLWVYEANEMARNIYEHLGATLVHTIETIADDGTKCKACRYKWENVSSVL